MAVSMTAKDSGSGHDKRLCGGKKHQGIGTCRRPAGWGTPHPGFGRCKLHGGSTQSHVEAAQGQRASELVSSLMLGGTQAVPVGDPVAYAQQLLGRLDAGIAAVEAAIGDGVADPEREWSADRRVKVAALTQLLREGRRLSVDLGRLGLEDRATVVLEAQVEQHAAVLDAVLEALQAGLVRALVDLEGAVGVVERVWPVLVGEVVAREWRALEDGRTT